MKIIVDEVPRLKSDCLFVGFKKDRYVCCFYQTLRDPLTCLLRSDENGNPYCPFLKEENINGTQNSKNTA